VQLSAFQLITTCMHAALARERCDTFDIYDFSGLNVTDEGAVLASGWFAQPWMDLGCLSVFGEVYAATGAAGVATDSHTRKERRVISCELMKNEKKISPRMKSYFRSVAGPGEHRGRALWQEVSTAADYDDRSRHLCLVIKIVDVEKWVDKLNATVSAGRLEDTYDTVVDMHQECGEMICALGHVNSKNASCGGDPEEAEAVAVAKRCSSAICEAITLSRA
jgi:hypothetical protein